MVSKGFIDLDELVLLCRNDKAKSFIHEAVQCYKGTAYRQTIVATWIAVVYDIIHKLQELEMTGDANATKVLANYEKIRTENDIKGSLEFERGILDTAKKEFELLSEIEYIDLIRLRDDRNRCAHPAMNLNDEIYQPSPELARSHLRNAIEYLLQRPPVQGKAALARLMSDVDSDYFPTKVEEAVKHFSDGPLARPRASLVRNFVIALIKNFLGQELDIRSKVSHYIALLAMSELHSRIFHETLAEKLNDIVVALPDEYLVNVLSFVADISDTWQWLRENSKNKVRMYVRNMPLEEEFVSLKNAFVIPDLIPDALVRLDYAEASGFIPLIDSLDALNENVRLQILEKSIENYKRAESFSAANNAGKNIIIPLANKFAPNQIEEIIQICAEHSQVKPSYERKNVLRALLKNHHMTRERFKALLEKYEIDDFDLPKDD